jgi:hypothetical protein
MDAHRTATLPAHARDGFAGPDLITALRIHGADGEHVMLVGQPRFALGASASCEIVVDRPYVSSLHAMLERCENRVRVHDLSKNGIIFRGRYEKRFDIGPGDIFTLGEDNNRVYALSDEMRLARPVLAEVLSEQRFADIDDLLLTALHGDHVLLLGEPGSDQERLARAIHSASLRRRHHFVKATSSADGQLDRQLLAFATRGTLWLDVESTAAAIDTSALEQLLAPEANVRLVLGARTRDVARAAVGGDLLARLHVVRISPLRERAGDLATLIERAFIDRRSTLRFTDLTEANQAALLDNPWTGNLEQLREVADRLVQIAPCANDRTAATALKMPRTTFQRWLDVHRLALPLLRETPRQR